MDVRIDAVGGGEDVSVGDENATAELFGVAAQQGDHPGPLARIGWPTTDDTRADVVRVLTAALGRRLRHRRWLRVVGERFR